MQEFNVRFVSVSDLDQVSGRLMVSYVPKSTKKRITIEELKARFESIDDEKRSGKLMDGDEFFELLEIYDTPLKTFDNICTEWNLKVAEKAALAVSREPDANSLERISRVISIYGSLHTIFQNSDQANTWIHRPNQVFESKTALSVMLDEQDGLERVQQYLLHQVNS